MARPHYHALWAHALWARRRAARTRHGGETMASARDTQRDVPHDHDGHTLHGSEPHGDQEHDHEQATPEPHGDHDHDHDQEHHHDHGSLPQGRPAHTGHDHDHQPHTHEPGGLLGHLPFFH